MTGSMTLVKQIFMTFDQRTDIAERLVEHLLKDGVPYWYQTIGVGKRGPQVILYVYVKKRFGLNDAAAVPKTWEGLTVETKLTSIRPARGATK